MIIDGNNLILGRLGTFVAKKALQGEKIDILNCENIVITGKKESIFAQHNRRKDMGIHSKGPFTIRLPDRLVKRMIRGMLPYKKEKGKNALNNIKCHVGIPKNLADEKSITIETANVNNKTRNKYVKIKEICKKIGGKI